MKKTGLSLHFAKSLFLSHCDTIFPAYTLSNSGSCAHVTSCCFFNKWCYLSLLALNMGIPLSMCLINSSC